MTTDRTRHLNRIKASAPLLALLALILVAPACSDDDGDDSGNSGQGSQNDDDHDHAHEGACGEIEEVCAAKDDGTDAAVTACHALAHDGPETECEAQEEACIEACGGEAHEHEGEEHEHEGEG